MRMIGHSLHISIASILALLNSAAGLNIAVTGAHGYLGAEICWQAAAEGHSVRAVGRGSGFATLLPPSCDCMDLDDLTDPVMARQAADGMDVVIHTAGVFRKVDNMESELVSVNIELVEQMVCACAAATQTGGARLVLTSSMAAVRGEGQPPSNGGWYTSRDWNTISMRDGPGFAPYQYSKMASERRAMELASEVGLELVCLCPGMILGPPRDPASTAFSVDMVRGWTKGDGPVRSLLVSDVRDVAKAHLNAAVRPGPLGQCRYIVACECRSPASSEADAVRRGLLRNPAEALSVLQKKSDVELPDPSVVHAAEGSEAGGGNGAIPIGQKEVEAADALWSDLGVRCRPSAETLEDMAAVIQL